MGTTLRFKVGLVLALFGLLTLTFNSPSLALAQDEEQTTQVDAAQTTDEETPPADDETTGAADDDASAPPAEVVEPEPEPQPPADTAAPWIDQPSDVYAAAVDGSGAGVDYAVPGASDDVDGGVGV
ncbi:MAG TPA: hypothetical protein VKB09_07085, partial [Thermomicrobiales bacterium]|nr:hypothetical protein [Thermomicrobiales bacterium]